MENEVEEVVEETVETTEDAPDVSAEDTAKAEVDYKQKYEQLESLYGRQSNEVGEARAKLQDLEARIAQNPKAWEAFYSGHAASAAPDAMAEIDALIADGKGKEAMRRIGQLQAKAELSPLQNEVAQLRLELSRAKQSEQFKELEREYQISTDIKKEVKDLLDKHPNASAQDALSHVVLTRKESLVRKPKTKPKATDTSPTGRGNAELASNSPEAYWESRLAAYGLKKD